MAFKALEIIVTKLTEVLAAKDYVCTEAEKETAEGPCAQFRNETSAVLVLYNTEKKRFELCTAEAAKDEEVEEWKTVSMYLYDEENDPISEVQSIATEFSETLVASKKTAIASSAANKKKKKKDDEDSTTNPLFFFNRLSNVLPEIKTELNNEKIAYGDVRSFTFAKEKVLPVLASLIDSYPTSDVCVRVCEILSDMYKNGDLDTRSIITYIIINGLSEKQLEAITPNLKEDLEKAVPASRKLIGKKIKPEVVKKKKTMMQKSLEVYSTLENNK